MKVDHAKLVAEFLNVEEVQPGRCEQEIFDDGEFFCCLAGPRSWVIEAWVKKIRELSGQRIDWNFSGGRAVVNFLGGTEAHKRLVEAAEATRPALEEAALKTSTSDLVRDGVFPAVQWLNPEHPWSVASA